jgi:succinate-semialdehyde dehydrogenase/glutarate-semialdehyde dehydrogenase
MVNDHLVSHGMHETPWGGVKESGIGRTHGEIGFEEMTEPQVIIHDYLPMVRRNMWWHPHGSHVYRGVRGIVHALFASSLGKRMSGLWDMLRLFPRTFLAR